MITNNKLETIPDEMFKGLISLRHLEIRNNPLKYFERYTEYLKNVKVYD